MNQNSLLRLAYDPVNDITSINDAAGLGDGDHDRDDQGKGKHSFNLSQSFTYNARNRNSAIETQGMDHGHWGHDGDHDRDDHDSDARGGADYLYNALGERVAKNPTGRDHAFNGGRTHFIYDQDSNLIAETDGSGHIARDYVYLDGLPVAMLEGDDARYIHTDHLGTPQKMTDEGQQVVWSRASEPLGKTVDLKGGTTLNLRFPGQYFDAESNLHYNINRSYAPGLGRYTQADPIGLNGGINRFGYVGQNPIRATDFYGLYPDPMCVAACTAIGTGLGYLGGGVFGFEISGGLGTITLANEGAALGGSGGALLGGMICQATDVQASWTITPSKAYPKGYLPGPTGAEQWGKRNGVDPDEARRKFHQIKQKAGGYGGENYGVNPGTGDVVDPQGESVGNLGN